MINYVVLQAVRVLGLTMLSFLLAFGLTPLVFRFISSLKFKKNIKPEKDAPIFHELHKGKAGTPTMGGIVIWLTVLVLAVLIFFFSTIFDGFWGYLNFVNRAETYLPLAALFAAAIVGFIDDLMGVRKIGPRGGGLKMRHRLAIYSIFSLIGALWFFYRLDWDLFNIPFVGNFHLGLWYVPVFVFILVASAFSANEADGLDGLAGGIMLFTFAALTVVAFSLGRFHLAAFSGVIIGALMAFLWFNIYPAKFFMGDTGSMSLGITIGVIAMLTNTPLLLIFFAPIFILESSSVIIQVLSKKIRKKKVFLSAPIHHHFEALGWHETRVTMRFWIITVIFASLGLVVFFLNQMF
ncbi:MAG: phospho-N-acetylmuramoyl-pentapeptide-transferase [Candidatus Harrisonbacteria bacterium CG10_big_fil_rev_8_21_14_0_10_44_23]|uniref:Phospho-N-acetylmuramoyl-pentapeptide-transferase n=1 Tax=Candidatus Harrisonbacteria bacterium CG10_big_fil_rev_8_21_14_0_10_44_23 TaxID=1974585 RepID=A0A2H0UPH4_9BACT|nr:MAG: phospho-N-acetylmuramoyl-pentapeptide-transferase [Candidatus Harrisonbacteria bacterium CG10_big_fil_rev_8_21_14_0_10_44_23]